ncbi:MAG TPA: TetR/AcrR family transcriptional regulator [Kofleriaceae bacterium]|nr:TetR/AcrR family transcriptional regulator [Kofleriaceae bacterium]
MRARKQEREIGRGRSSVGAPQTPIAPCELPSAASGLLERTRVFQTKKRTFVFRLIGRGTPPYDCGVPRHARIEKTKPSVERILEAAEGLFASNAYGDISLRQLIAAAGISTTAFYARFGSKEAVLDKLTESLFVGLQVEAATTLRSVKNLDEGIERGVDVLCARFAPRKSLVRLVIAESGSIGPTSSMRRKSYVMLVGFMAHYFKALAGRGRIEIGNARDGEAEAQAEALAWALVGALEMQIVRWAVWDELDIDELRAALIAVARVILPKERV